MHSPSTLIEISGAVADAGRRLSNAASVAGRRISDTAGAAARSATIAILQRVRWAVSVLTSDAYFFGNITFLSTMAIYVVFDLLDEGATSAEGIRDMLLVQATVGIASAIGYLLVWYGGEPLFTDLLAEVLNIISAVWYTAVVLLERYASTLNISISIVSWLEVSASLFFFIEAAAYAFAWFVSLPSDGSIMARLFQWSEVYFWGHLFNLLPAFFYVVCSTTAALPVDFPSFVESGRLPGAIPSALRWVCVVSDIIYFIDAVVWVVAWRRDIQLALASVSPIDDGAVSGAPDRCTSTTQLPLDAAAHEPERDSGRGTHILLDNNVSEPACDSGTTAKLL